MGKAVSTHRNPKEMGRLTQAKKGLKRWLVKHTGCAIQGGYPCGTCTNDLLADLGVKEDKQHNKPVDRVNEVWRAILQIREKKLKRII